MTPMEPAPGLPVLQSAEPIVADEREPLVSYAYSYPHKSSYRRLDPPVPIAEAWRTEELTRAALYVHIPFCEMRCGFCNLFTQSQPDGGFVAAYLETLARQMRVVREATGAAGIQQFAIGGGTPTYLSADQLTRLLGDAERTFEFSIRTVSTSVETSPATATEERLRVLAEFGVERVSLGVQSLDEADLGKIGRPSQLREAHRALDAIRRACFPVLNIDLIYGDPQQSLASWERSLEESLAYTPEEIFLYPLYVRPETGLARAGHCAAEHRQDLYRAGRATLLARGYRQTSLRCFRKPRVGPVATYSCEGDGLIGLGCGARSYTRSLHYATRFAVSRQGVRAILEDWTRQTDVELALATHGMRLSRNEQARRFVVLSLLRTEGLSRRAFEDRFPMPLERAVPELQEVREQGWALEVDGRIVLTEAGLENSDIVGPMLYSSEVRERLREFVRP